MVGTLRFTYPTLLIAISIALLFAVPAAAQKRPPDTPIKIDIVSRTIDAFSTREPDKTRFGALEFRGGLELTSSYREFGGLSAIRVAADGEHFVSLSDRGRWLTGRIAYDAQQ